MHVRSIGGREEELRYDQLVVALGSTSRTLPIPGLAEHALGFKTLSEGIALRNRLLQTLEQAEVEDDPAVRRELLTYVFVGAGYAGVEGLAELQDLAADVDRALSARAARGRPLRARRGARADHAGDPRRPGGRSPRPSCAGAAWRSGRARRSSA